MKRTTVIKSACGGLFTGISATAMIFNSAMHSPAPFIVAGIAGLLIGCGLLVVAFCEAR